LDALMAAGGHGEGERDDPEVARYQSWQSFTEEDGRSFIASLASMQPGDPGWFQFALEEKASSQFAGDCGLFIDPDDARLGRIGYSVAVEISTPSGPGAGHELRDPLRACVGLGLRVEAGLLVDLRGQQIGAEPGTRLRGLLDRLPILFGDCSGACGRAGDEHHRTSRKQPPSHCPNSTCRWRFANGRCSGRSTCPALALLVPHRHPARSRLDAR
jgi:hypothetical protein